MIQISNLHKQFDHREVLSGVDLKVNKGESIVVIGQSGCGKSVMLKHLVRLLEPDSGRITFDDADISKLHGRRLIDMRRRYGMLFQSAALFDSLTVAENVGLGLKEERVHTRSEIDAIVSEKLSMVGLPGSGDKFPDELSGGMRKRVGLARAIAAEPEVLLYDEPTTGLDPITADMINDLIVDLNTKLNVTSIAVTHDMTSAYKIADRIVMLYQGRVEFDGTPDEIRNSSNEVVKQFITGSATGPIQVG
ncbi:MAG: ABC transporter ATP-binding protein [candidate division Zixibacteria bacterium]|nr:ABC transporter ATP-binding protein [candidate division Zixibacteria bacterium]MDH3936875.1 ABC transporter ATP-binding protein [candidate division Zixibacteria bacterium]MDH4033612.1 ABC transporter ATP-binding protein [candidate division Zixibacteria bacterium]